MVFWDDDGGQTCASSGADRDGENFLGSSPFLRPLPGRVAWETAIRWFPGFALRTAVTDRLWAPMPPAC